MSAQLKGEGFEIAALSTESQLLNPQGVTTWRWEVKPTVFGGKRVLHVRVTSIVVTAVGQFTSDVPYEPWMDQEVEIQPNLTYQAGEILKGSVQTIMTALAGLVAGVWVATRKRAQIVANWFKRTVLHRYTVVTPVPVGMTTCPRCGKEQSDAKLFAPPFGSDREQRWPSVCAHCYMELLGTTYASGQQGSEGSPVNRR